MYNGSQTEKNFGYSKVTSAVLISRLRGLLNVIFRRIKCNEEYQVMNCCFFQTASVLKFNTEIYIFVKHPEN